MTWLHPLSQWLPDRTINHFDTLDALPTYWYEGPCPDTGTLLRLPRTPLAEAIAHRLMQQLAADARHAHDGKMYGILLVKTLTGEDRYVLKAFSGQLDGSSHHPGWVPPIPQTHSLAHQETIALRQLDAIKHQILTLQSLPQRQHYIQLQQQCDQERQALRDRHQQAKRDRHQQRQHLQRTLTDSALMTALAELDRQSQHNGIEQRRLKRDHAARLAPLKTAIDQADQQIRQLKRQRREISRTLQAQLHTTYALTNFAGHSRPLPSLLPHGSPPTGTGDCCAPKLLHHAAIHHLIPLAMAEFWWGPPSADGDKIQGRFYGACAERCQPLMGFLLSGAPSTRSPEIPPILYDDPWLIAIDKPSGLLSVPGRYPHTQDSVLSRLRLHHPDLPQLAPLHRLDQDTSGILLFAKTTNIHRQLSHQFQQHHVQKTYDARLCRPISSATGTIHLPLWSNPSDRPRQHVHFKLGKPSITHYRQLNISSQGHSHVELMPITGRTHQLRVHAAHPQGLNAPILGDRLYGESNHHSTGHSKIRLHLHARDLRFIHPHTNQPLHLTSPCPF